jgi:hypothetical protein
MKISLHKCQTMPRLPMEDSQVLEEHVSVNYRSCYRQTVR